MIEIQVLDKGYAKYIRHMGTDLSPVEDARMSTNNPTGVDSVKDNKLRARLWKDQHTSPFEGCVLCVELKIPLFILRQIERHRTLDIEDIEISEADDFRKYTSRNEFSGRYAQFEDEFYIPDRSRPARQDLKNKQGSVVSDEYLSSVLIDEISIHNTESFNTYDFMLDQGISRELARLVLPGTIYTKIRITANMLNWFKFLKLRLAEDAQWEVRQYANAIKTIIHSIWPECLNLFEQTI